MDTSDTSTEQAAIDQAMPTAEKDEGGSLSDHETQFYGDGTTAESAKTVDESEESVVAKPARDGQGKFVKSDGEKPKERHRAKSQEASPEDAPRIRELTAKWRAAEARAEEAERRHREATAPREPERRELVKTSTTLSKPNPDDEKKYPYGTVDPQYIEDLTEYKLAVLEEAREKKAAEDAQRTEGARIVKAFEQRRDAAAADYDDFAEVALDQTVPWQPGSLIDHWIWNRPYGPHLLYYLLHPNNAMELSELMGMDLDDQVEALTLLGQRWKAQPNGKAAETGSVARRETKSLPKPPNPVRTGPIQASREPLNEDASLADHEAAYYPSRRR